jgi:hypothetical protein
MYRLEKFGTTDIPNKAPRHDISTDGSLFVLRQLPGGGVYDEDGTGQSGAMQGTISARCLLTGTSGAINSNYNAWRSLRGKRSKLYRIHNDEATREWCYARLERVESERTAESIAGLEMTLNFAKVSTLWNGANRGAWELDDGEYFDSGLYFDGADYVHDLMSTTNHIWIITNDGNATVQNSTVAVYSSGTAITNLIVRRKIGATIYESWRYTENITKGKTITVDVGAKSVKLGSTDKYAKFTLGTSHISDNWLNLPAGANTIQVERAGGSTGSLITVSFYDGWE